MNDKAPGIYLRCDNYAGWSIVEVNEFGNEMMHVSGCMTMEEALRRFSQYANRPIELRLSGPRS